MKKRFLRLMGIVMAAVMLGTSADFSMLALADGESQELAGVSDNDIDDTNIVSEEADEGLSDEYVDENEAGISDDDVFITEDGATVGNPRNDGKGNVVWDCVYFGNYWQEDTNGDGEADTSDAKQPIKWRVLNVNGNDAFLLADMNLDCKPYNYIYTRGITWETCTLRSWLNGYGSSSNSYGTNFNYSNFIDTAFNLSEQSAIKTTTVVNADNSAYDIEGGNNTLDKIYLLSLDEVENGAYGFSTDLDEYGESRSKNTAYAKQQGAYTYTESDSKYDGNGFWWLRSPGSGSSTASYVDFDGWVSRVGYHVGSTWYAVRPALHLNLSSSTVWSYAGTVTSAGTVSDDPGPSGPTTDGINNPRIEEAGKKVTWDCITLGSYQQTKGVSPEPIVWRVLSVDGDKALVLSDKILEKKKYNETATDVTWETCSLRSWLNGDFYNEAFSSSEKGAVLESTVSTPTNSYGISGGNDTTDKVFVLSSEEAKKIEYGFTAIDDANRYRECDCTPISAVSNYWLRNIGYNSKKAQLLDKKGYIYTRGYPVDHSSVGVRPAMWIDIDSTEWNYYGTVTGFADEKLDKTVYLDYMKVRDDKNVGVLTVNCCDSLFLTQDNNKYSQEIGMYAIGLSTLVYASTKKDGNIVKGLKKLGYDENETDGNAYLKKHYYDDDTKDTTGEKSPCWIVHKTVRGNNKECTLVSVIIRGTSGKEWFDNFESGTGRTHKGFQNAADYVYVKLKNYIKANNLQTDNLKILVTGHSRGAAAANLLGKKLDDNKDNLSYLKRDNIYVYTFATPNVSKDGDQRMAVGNRTYTNIYNIVNPEDFVTKVLPWRWGYTRYGTTYVLPSATTDSLSYYNPYLSKLNQEYRKYTGGMTYEPYDNGMVEVSTLVDEVYKNVKNIDEYYNKSLSPTWKKLKLGDLSNQYVLNRLFKYLLGAAMCDEGDMLKSNIISIATQSYGTLGDIVLAYFIWYQGVELNKKQLKKWNIDRATWNDSTIMNHTIVSNKFGYAHGAETYLAAMNVIKSYDIIKERKALKCIVNCPVDVTVKDEDGNVVASIVNNEIISDSDTSLAMYVEGDSKSVFIPADGAFNIELTGNDNGTMDYSLCYIDPDGGEIERYYYNNIPVVNGETYTQECEIIDEYLEVGDLLEEDDSVVGITDYFDYENLGSLSYEVTIEGIGSASSIYNVTPGDYVTLVAEPDENNSFLGWYDSLGTKISEDNEYSFSAETSAAYTAKFTNVVVDIQSIDFTEKAVRVVVGDYYLNTLTYKPTNATYKYATYKSSDETVATVDEFGIVTTLKPGTTTITATSVVGNKIGNYTLTVTAGAEYNLSLDANGGTFDEVDAGVKLSNDKTKSIVVVTNTLAYGQLPNPVNSKYVFAGWFTEKTGGTEVTADTIVNLTADQTLYAHWDNITLAVKQKFDASKCFAGVEGIKKYKIEKSDGAKGAVTKKGIVTSSKPGKITITPLTKVGKKYESIEGAEPLVLIIVKPEAKKKLDATVGQTIKVDDIITNLPANSNEVQLALPKKCKVATYDEATNTVTLTAKGKVKLTVIVTNDQDKSVKYSCTVKIKE